jgi:hypothetical protein
VEDFKISKLYEKISEYNVDLNTFYKLFIIMAVRLGKYDDLIKNIPKLKTVVEKLFDEGILFRVQGILSINIRNYNKSKYKQILEKHEVLMDFDTLFSTISKLWRGKRGVGSNNMRYMLFDSTKSRQMLAKFIEENTDVSYDVILKANEEFLAQLEITDTTDYKAAPKCSTFITGNERNGYLIEYCYNIMNRQKLQKDIRINFNDEVYGGFGTDI